MARCRVLALDAQTTISLGGFNKKTRKENPTKAEGYFLGTKDIPDPKKKNGFSYLHHLQTPNGIVGVWGKTDLDKKMRLIAPGVYVWLENTGNTMPTANGDMQLFNVDHDPNDAIEVNSLPPNESNSNPNGGAYGESDDASVDNYDASQFQDEDDDQDEALLKAERAAKVEALLGSKKSAGGKSKN